MERQFTGWQLVALLALLLPGTELRGQDLSSSEQESLGGLIFRNPDQERRIRQLAEDAADRLEQGRTEEGLRLLQRMLQDGEDGFYWNEDAKQFTSVRLLAARVISRLTPDQLKIYDEIYGRQEALPLLNQYVERRDIRGLHQLADRFFHTESGFRAVEFLAWYYYDRGDFSRAAAFWQELLAEPVHQPRLREEHYFLAAFNAELAGKPVPAAWLKPLRDHRFTFGPDEKPVSEWLSLARAWRLKQGDSREAPPGLTPPASQPLWVYSLGEGEKNLLHQHLRDRMVSRFQSHESVAVTATPALAAGRVIFRDERGVTAIELQTGKPVWRQTLKTSLQPLLEQIDEVYTGQESGRDYVSEMELRYFNNSMQNVLTTDGQLVYCIDGLSLVEVLERRYRRRDPFAGPRRIRTEGGAINQLVALRAGDGQPAWKLGGPEKPGEPPLPLAGHFFLSPPLVSDGLLYAVTERRGQLNLLCLESATGRTVWSQGIAFSSLELEEDPNRYYRLCPLALTDDLVIAATQLGLLIAVDRHTGSPRWVYSSTDEEVLRYNDVSEISRQSYGSPGFLNIPHVSGDRIVIMPAQSRYIHALDLRTGRRLWRVPRYNAQPTEYDRFTTPNGAGDEYIGCVSGETVLVVGGQRCRGLNVATGAEQWTLATGMASGRGVQSDHRYLLPLQTGRVAVIDIASGQEVGVSFGLARSGVAPEIPGNLLPVGDALLSVRADRISLHPQAEQQLDRLNQALARESTPATLLEAARLELQVGGMTGAEQRLQQLLAVQPEHPEGRALLQEVIYYQLERNPALADAGREDLLRRLTPLAGTPDQRMRLLMAREQQAFRERNLSLLRDVYHQAADLEAETQLVQPDGEPCQFSPLAWVAARSRKLTRELTPAQQNAWRTLLLPGLETARNSGQPAEYRRQLAFWEGQPEAAGLRQQLAEVEISRGQYQAAELLLIHNRGDADRAVAARATFTLYQLWDRLRLPYESARLLAELKGKYADVTLASGETVAAELADVPPAPAGPDWLRQVERVQIASRLTLGAPDWLAQGYSAECPAVIEAFDNPGLPVAQTIRRWIDPGKKQDSTEDDLQKLRFVDELTGATLHEMKLPLPEVDMQSEFGHSFRSSVPHTRIGHFFPMGARGAVHGLSLFAAADKEPLWSRQPPRSLRDSDISSVWLPGPAHPAFCCFQLGNQLIVLEPGTGKILWQRSDLDLNSGLAVDARGGIFGDEQVLVILQNDGRSYVACDTLTGQVLRRGSLPLESTPLNRPLGRHLLYLEERRDEGPFRLRVWDPLTDKIIWRAESKTYPRYDEADSRELFLLLDDTRLVMLDPLTLQPRLDVRCDADMAERLNQLQVFSDDENFYVNFRQYEPPPNPFANPIGGELREEQFAPATLPHLDLIGPVLAIHRETQQVRWRQDLAARTVLRLPQWDLPFLVLISRVQLGFDSQETHLLVEIVDRQTGSLLGSAELPDLLSQDEPREGRFREPLYSDKLHNLVRAECDPAAGLLTLIFLYEVRPQEGELQPHGLQQQVLIRFDPATQRLLAPDIGSHGREEWERGR